MRHTGRLSAALLTVGLLAWVAPSALAAERPWVAQIGTYDALMAPNYTGIAAMSSALNGQTLGLGTFDHLDGELVMIGGTAYRVGTDGVPTKVETSASVPFFESIAFTAEASAPVPPGTTCANLATAVNTLVGSSNGVVAVRVRGTFTDLVTRSVPRQSEPYPEFADVVAQQTVFPLGQRRAVLVGFRTGPDMAGIGAPGLHLHGLTADRTAGGHVVSCVAGNDVQLSVTRTAGVAISGA